MKKYKNFNKYYKGTKKLDDYLYYFENDKPLDWQWYDEFVKTHYIPLKGACSSVKCGQYYGRNFDWYIDRESGFVVKTSKIEGRHASLGLCGPSRTLTQEIIEGNIDNEYIKFIPFMTVDAINDCGVVANINVVPAGEKGKITQTTPKIETRKKLPMYGLVRFIVDNFSSAKQAVEYISNYISVFMPIPKENLAIEELHLMVSDLSNTYVLEIVNNELKVIDVKKYPYMTNFFLYDIKRLPDGKFDLRTSTKDRFGSGIRRYNMIVENYQSLSSLDGMKNFMRNDIKFTNAYNKNDFWYDEAIGSYKTFGDLTIQDLATDVTKFYPIAEYMQMLFDRRNEPEYYRAGEVWQTVHTSIYDMVEKKLYLTSQEKDKEFVFSLKDKKKRALKRLICTFRKSSLTNYNVPFVED